MSVEITKDLDRILVVDDDPSTILIVKEALKSEGYLVESAENGAAALEKMEDWSPSLVLLDINMPGINGVDTLKEIRKKKDYTSTMFVSGNSKTGDIIGGLDSGADDYICKPFNVMELLARVRAQLRIKKLQDQLKVANSKLEKLVVTDDLTGLFNMRSLYDRLDRELARGSRFNRRLAVVMMDMDHFKSVNDSNDHLFGSFVLSEVGKIIQKNIRKIDFAARYGGDEFLIVLSEVDLKGAQSFCERLRSGLEKATFTKDGYSMNLTCSLGFAITDPTIPIPAKELVRKADHALYEAKETGRNRVCYYNLKSETKTKKCS